MYTAIIIYLERHLPVNRPTQPKAKQPSEEKEAITLMFYTLGAVVLILIAIYFMTL